MSKPVFYSISPYGTGSSYDIKNGSPNITISSGVATLSVAQTGNIGVGCRIEYNSTHCFIAPNRIGFDSGGTVEIKIGDKIEGGTSSATGIVRAVHLSSGTWAGGNAAGYIYFEQTSGTWQDNEQINRTKPSSSINVGTTDGTLEGNIGGDNDEFVVLTATGGTPSDQTSTSVTYIYHEYASLSTWEAGFTDSNHLNTTDLTTDSIIAYACHYYDHDDSTADGKVSIDFGTTDEDGYVFVFAPAGEAESINRQRHSGVWDDDKSSIASTSDLVTSSENYSVFDGLQLNITDTTNYCNGFKISSTNNLIENCICKDTGGSGDDHYAIYATSSASPCYIHDCIIYDLSNTWGLGLYGLAGDDSIHMYSCTSINCDRNYYTSYEDTIAKNCVGFNCATACFSGTYATGTEYNAYGDGSDPGTNGVDISSDAGTDLFKDYNNDDFNVKDNSSSLYDAGTDLSSDSNLPIWRDIAGNERGSSWDIGAFEYVSTSSTPEEEAPLSGVGTVTASGQQISSEAAPIVGVGSITALGSHVAESAAPVGSVGAVTAAGQLIGSASAPVAGVGAVTAAGTMVTENSGPLAGVGSIVSDGQHVGQNTGPVTGIGAVTSEGQHITESAGPLSCVGSITCAGESVTTKSSAAPLSCVGAIISAGQQISSEASPLVGVGSVVSVGQKISSESGPISCVGAITCAGEVVQSRQSAAPLEAVGTVTSAGEKTAESVGPLGSVGATEGTGQKIAENAAPIGAVGSITADGEKVTPSESAPISCVGSITAAGEKDARASPTVTGVGSITGTGQHIGQGSGPLAGVGAITATGNNPATLTAGGIITTTSLVQASTTITLVQACTTITLTTE